MNRIYTFAEHSGNVASDQQHSSCCEKLLFPKHLSKQMGKHTYTKKLVDTLKLHIRRYGPN